MHIRTLSLPHELRVMIQSSIENPGPDVVYLIPRGCPVYKTLLNTLQLNMQITRNQIRLIHSRALSNASSITVTYPKLKHIRAQVHNQQQETTHGSV